MAQRWAWSTQAYFPGINLAPTTDTNYAFPNYPQSKKIGPAVLRMPPPYFPQDNQAPLTDPNFGFPTYGTCRMRRTGPSILRGSRRSYFPGVVQAPVTDANFAFPQYPPRSGPRILRLRHGRQVFVWPFTSGVSFPTQYDGFYIRREGSSIALCLVATADAPSGMGGQPRIRKGGVTYAIYLVETTDENASPARLQTSAGTKAVRLKT